VRAQPATSLTTTSISSIRLIRAGARLVVTGTRAARIAVATGIEPLALDRCAGMLY
jgi:hypothetical protein